MWPDLSGSEHSPVAGEYYFPNKVCSMELVNIKMKPDVAMQYTHSHRPTCELKVPEFTTLICTLI
jgi:hypothetical protein